MSWKTPGRKLTWADWPVPASTADNNASPSDERTNDILRISRVLEDRNIPCCLVGVSALIFYGAQRYRLHWEICIPTELVNDAAQLLQSDKFKKDWHICESWPHYSKSLVWSYHRFEGEQLNYHFILVPAKDVHLALDPVKLTRSVRGLPYPKLDIFIQSSLDTHDMLQLVDTVDGTDVSEEWGEENLELEGKTDTEWAQDLNKRGRELAGNRFGAVPGFANDGPRSKRQMWQEAVRTKEKRMDWTKPKHIYTMQYRFRDEPEPWTVLSDSY